MKKIELLFLFLFLEKLKILFLKNLKTLFFKKKLKNIIF